MPLANPKIRYFMILLYLVALCCQVALADAEPRIKTNKDIYFAGESIQVHYFNAPGHRRDWICIVPEGAAEDDGGNYDYIPKGTNQGVLTFQSPPPGKYEVRAYYHYSRNGYVVSARYKFMVKAFMPPPLPASTQLDHAAGPETTKPDVTLNKQAVPVKVNVCVFHFIPLSIDATKYGGMVANVLINSQEIRTSFAIMGKKDLELFLTARSLRQDDKVDNIIRIGSGLGVNFVIAGNVDKRGAMIVTNCKVVDIAQRDIIFEKQFISVGESELFDDVIKMSRSIAEVIRRNIN